MAQQDGCTTTTSGQTGTRTLIDSEVVLFNQDMIKNSENVTKDCCS